MIAINRILKGAVLICSLLSFLVGLSVEGVAHAQGPCGDSYVVRPGDTLSEIAEICGVSVDGVLNLNPEISDSGQIYSGQILRIPHVESFAGPIVAISPDCGFPGTPLIVLGSGFPTDSIVQVNAGPVNRPDDVTLQTTTDEFGRIDTTISIPSSITQEDTWVVVAEARISSARFTGTSNSFSIIGQTPNPNASINYEAIAGDTLTAIAVKFNRDPRSILRSNAGLSESDPLAPGQIVVIPARERGYPRTNLAPICGPPGSTLTITGDDFPPGSNANLTMGIYLDAYQPVATARTDPDRVFTTNLEIPDTARPGDHWVVMAVSETTPIVRSSSNLFSVTEQRDPNDQSIYIVKPGDTLNRVSDSVRRSVASILSANPQITNPNVLGFGDRLLIPPQASSLTVTPTGGPPGTQVRIAGQGLPMNSTITLGIGPDESSFEILGTVTADENGLFISESIVPLRAVPGENWVVVSVRSTATGLQSSIISNEFVVTRTEQPEDPFISIWPVSGKPGTLLRVVGSNFPAYVQVEYSLGRSLPELDLVGTTWTEINGTFAIEIRIPTGARIGEGWIFMAETVDEPVVTATSPIFAILGESPE